MMAAAVDSSWNDSSGLVWNHVSSCVSWNLGAMYRSETYKVLRKMQGPDDE